MSFGQNTQIFNGKAFKKIEKQIVISKKQLEELKLQEESQNTRLLKIQQKERAVDQEYRDKKKKMDDTMEVLRFEADKFNEQQSQMNHDLEQKKEALVVVNDRKKKQEEGRLKKEAEQNVLRDKELEEQKKIKAEYEVELSELKAQIESMRQYENFLKKVPELAEEFQVEDKEGDNGVKQIIERYNTLKIKEKDFKQQADKIESAKDEVNRQIIQVRKLIEEENLGFNQKQNTLKMQIDELNSKNRKLESEIEGKQNQNNSKQAEFAQIILAIKNCHSQIKIKQEEENQQHNNNSTKDTTQQVYEDTVTKNSVILDKLSFIRERLATNFLIKDEWERMKKAETQKNHH